MAKKLTKEQKSRLIMETDWTEEELNDPTVLAIRRSLQEKSDRPSFDNVDGGFRTSEVDQPEQEASPWGSVFDRGPEVSQFLRDSAMGGLASFGSGITQVLGNREALPEAGIGQILRMQDQATDLIPDISTAKEALRVISRSVSDDWFNESLERRQAAEKHVQSLDTPIKREASEAVGDFLGSPSSALSVIGGPFAAGIAGGDVYAQEFNALIRQGVDPEDARIIAGSKGGIEALFSVVPTGKLLGGRGKDAIKSDARLLAERIVKTTVGEGLQEGVTEAAQIGVDAVAARTADNARTREVAAANTVNFWGQVWRATKAGFVGGHVIGSPTEAMQVSAEAGARHAELMAEYRRAADKKAETQTTERPAEVTQPDMFGPAPDGTPSFAEQDVRRRDNIETDAIRKLNGRTEADAEALNQALGVRAVLNSRLANGTASEQDRALLPVVESRIGELTSKLRTAPQPVEQQAEQPDLFTEQEQAQLDAQRRDAIGRRNAAKTLIAKDTKEVQSKAKSTRAAEKRKFQSQILASSRNMPAEDRADFVAEQLADWEANNPLEKFVAQASQPPKGRKEKKVKGVQVTPRTETKQQTPEEARDESAERLAKFEQVAGLRQRTTTEGDSEGGVDRVYRAMLGRVGSSDVKLIHKLIKDGNLKIVENASDIEGLSQKDDGKTAGYYDGKTTYVVASALDPENTIGDMLSVAAHEVKHGADVSGKVRKGSIRNLVGENANKQVVSKLEALAEKDESVMDLINFVRTNTDSQAEYELELPAHFINEGFEKRKSKSLTKRVTDDIVSAIRTGAKSKLGISDVNLNDVQYLARKLLEDVAVRGENLEGDVPSNLKMVMYRTAKGFNDAQQKGITYKSVDGNEKFVISDSGSKIKPEGLAEVEDNRTADWRVRDILEHEELFKQLPITGSLVVRFRSPDEMTDNAWGEYDPVDHSINLNTDLLDQPTGEPSLRSVLLHEIQHYIQDQGGNKKNFFSTKDARPKEDDDIVEGRKTAQEMLDKRVREFLDNVRPMTKDWPAADKQRALKTLFDRNLSNNEKADTIIEIGRPHDILANRLVQQIDALQRSVEDTDGEVRRIKREDHDRYLENITEAEAHFVQDNLDNPNPPTNPEQGSFRKKDIRGGDGRRLNKTGLKQTIRDTPSISTIPKIVKVNNDTVKEMLRVAERLYVPGGFIDSELKERLGHASHLPASLMAKATKLGNDMLVAIDKNAAALAGKNATADQIRKSNQKLRVELGKEIERIDTLETKAERDAALDAMERDPRFKGIGAAVRAIRDYKMSLTREIIALRMRDPKPWTDKERAIYDKMIENAERYTTRAYLATYNNDIGEKYGRNLMKRYEMNPNSLEGRVVQKALDWLVANEVVIPDIEGLNALTTSRIRRMHENWIGSTNKFKGDKGRQAMINALANLDPKTKKEIDDKAMEIVKEMLNLNKNKSVSGRFYTIGAKQNRTILESRTDLPPELRALMGEITDPFLREAISLQRMINLSSKTKLLTEVFEDGKEKGWWSDTKTDDHEFQLNDISYGPMQGKWINTDLRDALTGTLLSLESTDKLIADSIHNPTAFSQFLAGKSVKTLTALSRIQKTYRIVFSFAQMLLNLGGAFLNVGLNGIINPKTAGKGMKDAFLVLTSEINDRVITDETLPTIQEIIRAGVVDSATVGEFKSQAYQKIAEQIQKLDPNQPGFFGKLKKIVWDGFIKADGPTANAVRQVYAFMDIWTKVATYHDRKNFLAAYAKAEGLKWSEEYIQRRAGFEASGTSVSYERAIPIAKIVEKNVPFGMFLTYFSEVYRTVATSYLQAALDARLAATAKDPKAKALATAKATTRFIGTSAVTGGLIAATLNAIGSEDDDEKLRRRLDPEWIQNKMLLAMGLDKEGHEVLFEINRFDPNGPLNEAVIAVMLAPEGKRAGAIVEQVKGLFVPAQGAIATYRTLHDLVIESFARATGNEGIREFDMASSRTYTERNYPESFVKLKRALSYGDFGENFLSAVEKLYTPASLQPLVDTKGRVTEVKEGQTDLGNVPQGLGYRPYVRNPDESFGFKVRDYQTAMKEINKDKAKLLRDASVMSEEELVDELTSLKLREQEAFDTLRSMYESYLAYGKSNRDAAEHFSDNKKLFQQIRYNRFQSHVIDTKTLRDWGKRQVRQGRDRAEVNNVVAVLRKAYIETARETD